MTTKTTDETQTSAPSEAEARPHVHGPHCNHGHTPLSPIVRQLPKVGRNEDCPCGSQKKYKKCCGK